MAFYLRRSIRVGPMRFHFSPSGVGVSAGVKGFRVGTGPRGNYVHLGAGMLQYRATVPRAHPSAPPVPRPVPALPSIDQEPRFERIDSGDVLRMVNSSSASLLEEINRAARRSPAWPWIGALFLFGFVMLHGALSAVGFWMMFVLGAAATGWTFWRDELARGVVLFYDLEPDAEAAFTNLHECFDGLRTAAAGWNVDAQAAVADRKRNAGASVLLRRDAVRLRHGAPGVIRTNVQVPVLPAGVETLYFFPDRLLITSPRGVGAVEYAALRMTVSESRFIEEGPLPRDAQVVDWTWRYVNRSGEPDRRFKDNQRIPVVLYENLHLQSDSGLNELFQLSRRGGSAPFRDAVRRLAAVAAQPGARSFHDTGGPAHR